MAFQPSNSPLSKLPLIMIAAGLLFMGGALILGLNLSRTTGETASPATVTAAIPTPTLIAFATNDTLQIPRVTLDKAKEAFDKKTAVFVDVRGAESYAEDHIPGAVSIPMAELQSRQKELKTSDWIITYCT